jgi:hypothetical protein
MPFFDKQVDDKGNLTTFLGVVQDFGNYTVDELISSLQSKVKGFTSKNLEQSIRFDVVPAGKDSYRFTVYFDEYGNYIDEGVQGIGSQGLSDEAKKKKSWFNSQPQSQFRYKPGKKNRPSEKHFRTWARVHGLNSFAVRESVWRSGLKANEWFTDVKDRDLVAELIKRFETNGAKQMEIDFAETILSKWRSQ